MDMVVDTSILVAIVQKEPGYERAEATVANADKCLISAVSLFEAGMVLYGRFQDAGLSALDILVAGSDIDIVPFDSVHAALARAAFQRFGKGQGHPAQLNLADCCAYALAKSRGLPLLFKGNDFSRTDIAAASY